MKELSFKFYSVLKNEDANPYIGGNIIVAADGLGGSGSAVHAVDRTKHGDMRADVIESAFGDLKELSTELQAYIDELIAPMVDGKDDTSALWASRIVIARCVYALTEGEFVNCNLSDEKTREKLAGFIQAGLHETARKFDLQKGKYDGQLLLPTTLSFMRYTEAEGSVMVETLWAGDSRCYALTTDGLKVLSIDDEDGSGSITNLFYADNKKVKLNYLCHEISKPCALFAVSDGVFDPFDPHDNLGVEYTLLSAIKECDSVDGVAEALCNFYTKVHGDDVTMAFLSLGFSDYSELKNDFAARTEKITAIRQEQAKHGSALEVMNQSEEDASHYVASRTRDRYDYIAPILVEAVESGVADIVITPEIKSLIENAKRDYGEVAERARRQRRERGLQELNEYVKANYAIAASEILTTVPIQFNDDLLRYTYANFCGAAAEIAIHTKKKNELLIRKQALAAKKQSLHVRVMEKINSYRKKFDAAWCIENEDGKSLRKTAYEILNVWQGIDYALSLDWGLQGLAALPQEDKDLAYEVQQYVDDFKAVRRDDNFLKSTLERQIRAYYGCWDKLYDWLKNDIGLVSTLLKPEISHKFGLDISDESFAIELNKGQRDKVLLEMKTRREDMIPVIVRALASEYDKTSIIDGQYNATKLALFRTYYSLRATDSGDVKIFEERLAALEAEYFSLVIK